MRTFSPAGKNIWGLADEIISPSEEAFDLSKGTYIKPSDKI